MKSFMAVIELRAIDRPTLERLRPEEGKMLGRFAAEGFLRGAHVRADLGGAFLIVEAASRDVALARLAELPLHPYMKLDLVELEAAAPAGNRA